MPNMGSVSPRVGLASVLVLVGLQSLLELTGVSGVKLDAVKVGFIECKAKTRTIIYHV